MTPEQILTALDPEQQQAVQHPPGALVIIAGAGTGKTRTLTHRLAYGCLTGTWTPETILAVTHSARAAAELQERLLALDVGDVNARTIHSAALAQLRYFWTATGRPGTLQLLTRREPAIRHAMTQAAGGSPAPAVVNKIAAEISWAQSNLITPAQYANAHHERGRTIPYPPTQIAAAYAAYQHEKRDRGLVDHDDILTVTADLIHARPDIAQQIHNTYKHICVDEYQDTDPAQHRLITAWAGTPEQLRDGTRSLTAVGDPNQAIYAFKGGDAHHLHHLADTLDAPVVRLTRNYRSTEQILAPARAVLHLPDDALTSQQADGPAPTLTRHTSAEDEAAAIATRIHTHLHAGTPAGDIAVLARLNAQTDALEASLHQARIPTQPANTTRFFERPDTLTACQALAAEARDLPDEPGAHLLRMTLRDHFAFNRDQPPGRPGPAHTRWSTHMDLLRLVESQPGAETLTADAVLALLRDLAARQYEPPATAVTVTTLHKAKGLQWPVVLLAGLTQQALPAGRGADPQQATEEQRLLFVGMTRAGRHLHLSHHGAPSPLLTNALTQLNTATGQDFATT